MTKYEALLEDFKSYINSQVNHTSGVYACYCCKHRQSLEGYEVGCEYTECDGVNRWEYDGTWRKK